MEVYGIFEGGGAKGLAHVGALNAAETRGIRFRGVAGASAGAIVASLIAVGYRSTDLFDPQRPDDASMIFGSDFLRFFGPDWPAFEAFLGDAASLANHPLPPWAWLELPFFYVRNWPTLRRLKKQLGAFSTTALQHTLDQWLRSKLGKAGDDPVRFADLGEDCPLKIVATDISRQRLIVFSRADCPRHEVAKAVAASICLPYVFAPVRIDLDDFDDPRQRGETPGRQVLAVDGGLLSNFPAWLFDRERARSRQALPTLGFRLVARDESPQDEARWLDGGKPPVLGRFSGRLVRTVLNGDPLLETRQVNDLHEIPLNVSARTLDFRMAGERKVQLFDEGTHWAEAFFVRPNAPRDPHRVQLALELMVDVLRRFSGLPDTAVLRANVALPTGNGTLRITYAYGMQDDADDRLEFELADAREGGGHSAGACGLCWEDKVPALCDMTDAQENYEEKWHLSRYQQALVRRDVKSLLSVPIFNPVWNAETDPPEQQLIGTLNIDSDADLREWFGDAETTALVTRLTDEVLAEVFIT